MNASLNMVLDYKGRHAIAEQAYIMRRDEKWARENCTRICVCVGGGEGSYRCFNINDSIKIEKKKQDWGRSGREIMVVYNFDL